MFTKHSRSPRCPIVQGSWKVLIHLILLVVIWDVLFMQLRDQRYKRWCLYKCAASLAFNVLEPQSPDAKLHQATSFFLHLVEAFFLVWTLARKTGIFMHTEPFLRSFVRLPFLKYPPPHPTTLRAGLSLAIIIFIYIFLAKSFLHSHVNSTNLTASSPLYL